MFVGVVNSSRAGWSTVVARLGTQVLVSASVVARKYIKSFFYYNRLQQQ